MSKPGDVVVLEFPGAMGLKRRPAIVLSSHLYHLHRPDLILGLVTTNVIPGLAFFYMPGRDESGYDKDVPPLIGSSAPVGP